MSSVTRAAVGTYYIYFSNPTGTNYSFTATSAASGGWAADFGAGICTACANYGINTTYAVVLTGHSVSIPTYDMLFSVIFFGD